MWLAAVHCETEETAADPFTVNLGPAMESGALSWHIARRGLSRYSANPRQSVCYQQHTHISCQQHTHQLSTAHNTSAINSTQHISYQQHTHISYQQHLTPELSAAHTSADETAGTMAFSNLFPECVVGISFEEGQLAPHRLHPHVRGILNRSGLTLRPDRSIPRSHSNAGAESGEPCPACGGADWLPHHDDCPNRPMPPELSTCSVSS